MYIFRQHESFMDGGGTSKKVVKNRVNDRLLPCYKNSFNVKYSTEKCDLVFD